MVVSEKSKILIIGGTGYIGKYLVETSAKSGHPTFVLIRESTLVNPEKSKLIDTFKSYGVTLLFGDISNQESLLKAIKQVDVVISTVGGQQFADQVNIIKAIKEAGNIKRFLPSEFGFDVDHAHAIEPAASLFALKVKIRRMIEAEGIPYTYVICNWFADFFLPNLGQLEAKTPPRDKVVIFGDGNPKAIYVKEEDIATYTMKAVDDPRTLNKTLHMRPPANILSFNEIVSLWEEKIGKTLEKLYLSEEDILHIVQEGPMPLRVNLAICHSVFVNGDSANFEIQPSTGVEATELYPKVKYTTVDEYYNKFV
ncbi:isoflavone reductase homolog A622-like [Nicotiana tabacum]|uniref:Isoflavone reductase homolog A622-like n=1 Tax=Nicotiana tabacum TaxID=4097 RepID=A622L_TOBAC|nr:isoflavone reductase homolog A622-like [Nicotiana tabacum]XP_009608374.1 isoflavone reductase homolog A622-like [Nicotiana tomentosiformis]B6VRE6.1 RecName: Full=Isoflavone reductase homolog A622-like; Short=NtA622L [Nicotiana tabacum]AII71785.1 isoflavone reductase-like protein [Nicotiana tabacum]AII71786.1 isoflavone reductase-like protein [Nicotiana tabacum]BAG84265.1 isoflavone reductase-like protein [Nicotiana tabacum]BAG84266.1 isoflavone reductase-like protein [Nicotiana tabacum]